MKHTNWNLSIAILAMAAGALLLPVNTTSAASNPELHEKMEQLQDLYRDLGRGLRDASDETAPELIEAAQQMQLLTVESKGMEPVMPEGTSDEEKAEKQKSYRKLMIDTVDALLKIETALIDGNYDQAKEQFDILKAKKDEGHTEFRIDD